MRLYVEDGLLIVRSPRGAPRATLVACSIPGCSEILPEPEYEVHLLFHPDPVEDEPVTLVSAASEEGIYSVTSMK